MRSVEIRGTAGCSDVATAELAAALGAEIVARRPVAYRSTFPLDELTTRRPGEGERRLIFKDLSNGGAEGSGWRIRAPFLHDPLREIETYRDVLAPRAVSAPGFHAAVVEPQASRYWLFLEHVDGEPLWQVGDMEVWRDAARWLAVHHARFEGHTADLPGRLLARDAEYYRRWLERAGRFVHWREGAPADGGDFERLTRYYSRAVEWLMAQPRTLLHGEFYPSNVLVERCEGRPGIRPLDWEMAGIGPGLIDLAALASGVWSERERQALVSAYHAALPERLRPSLAEVREGVARSRFLQAVQWLGWSRRWRPPAEHAHDWLATALELAAEVPA